MPSGATQKQLLQSLQLVPKMTTVDFFTAIQPLDFRNKNIEILLQLSGKRLTICLIHNFNFITHNYRLSALQIQSWYE